MVHHYGSELNGIPLLEYYSQHPHDFYTLRVAYGGVLGGISNIDPEGFAPSAFHSFPSTLKNDGISGDYGSGFYGYAVNTKSYLYHHPVFGWLGFGGNVKNKNNIVVFTPTTAAKNKIFIESIGLDIQLLAGQVHTLHYDKKNNSVTLYLEKGNFITPEAILNYSNNYTLKGRYPLRNDGRYKIILSTKKYTIIVLDKKE